MSTLVDKGAVKYCIWNGEPKLYEIWKKKLMVNARKRKVLKGFMQEEKDLLMTTENDYNSKLEEFFELNDDAFAELVNSIDMNTKKGNLVLKYIFVFFS